MTDRDLERLRHAVARLRSAQGEALFVCDGALQSSGAYEEYGEVGLDEGERALESMRRLRAALEDVRAILGGASEDVRGILGGGELG